MFLSLAINYGKLLIDQAELQTGVDSVGITIENQVTRYYSQNGAWPGATQIATYLTQANSAVSIATNGVGTVASSDFHVCTPTSNDCSAVIKGQTVALSPGQVAIRATRSQTPIVSFGTTSSSNTVAATSVTSSSATLNSAATVNYQFQYAKGWYYKVVTLYIIPSGSTTPVALATWTYQPNNQATVATPSTSFPYFVSSATNSNTTDTGVGTVTTSYASGTTHDAAGNITLGSYSSLYLTMQVAYQSCAPGMTVTVSNGQSSWNNPNPLPVGTVTCSGNSNSNFNLTMSTNSPTNTNYIWINGAEQAANVGIPQMSAFPCSASATAGATQTTYYEWEDSNPNSGDRDFFFSLTTTCSAGHWTMGPPRLLH
jgi:hypothetical protein